MIWARLDWHLRQANGRLIVLYGAGRDTSALHHMLDSEFNPKQFAISFCVAKNWQDVKVWKAGGKEFIVHSPDCLNPERHYVLISSRRFDTEIETDLNNRGFEIGKDYFNGFRVTLPYSIQLGSKLEIKVGKNTYFHTDYEPKFYSEWFHSIGAFCSINYRALFVTDHNLTRIFTGTLNGMFDPKVKGVKLHKNKINMGNDVWIGAGAVINASRVSKIGNGAIIGAGAVVIEDVPPYAVVVGVPAKVKKYRYTKEEIEILEKVQWWNWDNETIYKNTELLFHPRLFFEAFS